MIEPALATATPAPEEDVTTALYRAAIGPVSNGYYLPIFTRFEAAEHAGISWNMAAALSTLNWLVFRQQWAAALAYFGALVAIVLLVFGIGRVVFQLPDTLVGALALGFGLAAFVLPGLFGNAVFHTDCRKRMSKALIAHSDVREAYAQLTRQASTRKQAIILAAANVIFWVLAVLLYLQLSALSNPTVMPTGALEAGQVAQGRTTDIARVASAPVAPPVASPASAPATEVSAPAETATVPASAPAIAASAPASIPVAALATASTPAPPVAAMNTMAMVDTVGREVTKSLPKTKPVAEAKPAKPAKHIKPYFVNVGLFAVAANAERAHAKLLAAQLTSQLSELKSTKGPQIRVRVGPFASKAEAQAVVGKIKALQLEAIVVQP
jgi:cell division septation protein DedD